MRPVVLCLFALWIGACNSSPESAPGKTPLFSLSTFIDEYLIYEDSLVDVSKTITVDGKVEKKVISEYDLRRDVEGFSTLDIDKPALWDKYLVDTIRQENQQTISYQALDESLTVKSMKLVLIDNKLQSVNILKSTSTFLADLRMEYAWTPSEGYILIRDEDRLFADPTHHEIAVRKNERFGTSN